MDHRQGSQLNEGTDRGTNNRSDLTALSGTAVEQWQGISTLSKPDAGMLIAQSTVDLQFGSLQIFELPARQAVEPMPPLGETIKRYDSQVKLNVQITNVPEVSHGLNWQQWLQQIDGAFAAAAQTVKPVESYMAQPNAVTDSLVGIGPILDNAVNYYTNTPADLVVRNAQAALTQLGDVLDRTFSYSRAPEERAKTAGSIMPMFFFAGSIKEPIHPAAAQQLGLEGMTEGELAALRIGRLAPDASDLHMPEVPEHLRHLELQKATPELIGSMQAKGREFVFSPEGSEDYRYLKAQKADAAAGGDHMTHILLKETPTKIAVLEEFLHGTQQRFGVIDRIGEPIAEIRVKDFMLRHPRLLGLTENELRVLDALRDQAEDYAFRRGYPWQKFRVGGHE